MSESIFKGKPGKTCVIDKTNAHEFKTIIGKPLVDALIKPNDLKSKSAIVTEVDVKNKIIKLRTS